jgi:hypothetical protein
MGDTDWERLHPASGLTVSGDTLTVTGTGDMGSVGEVGAPHLESVLRGLPIALLILIGVAVSARNPGANPPGRVALSSHLSSRLASPWSLRSVSAQASSARAPRSSSA